MVKLTQVLYEIGEKISYIIKKIQEITSDLSRVIVEIWGSSSPVGKSRITINSENINDLNSSLSFHISRGEDTVPSLSHWAKHIEVKLGELPDYLKNRSISEIQTLVKEFLTHRGVWRVPGEDTAPSDLSQFFRNPGGHPSVPFSHFSGSIKHKSFDLESYLEYEVEPKLLKSGSIKKEHFPDWGVITPVLNGQFSEGGFSDKTFGHSVMGRFSSFNNLVYWDFYFSVIGPVGKPTLLDWTLKISRMCSPEWRNYILNKSLEVTGTSYRKVQIGIPVSVVESYIGGKIYDDALFIRVEVRVRSVESNPITFFSTFGVFGVYRPSGSPEERQQEIPPET